MGWLRLKGVWKTGGGQGKEKGEVIVFFGTGEEGKICRG